MTKPKKPRRVAFYCRVSTDGQTVENQVLALQELAEKHGWEVVRIYRDEGISGAKGRDKRPGFDDLCRDITRREFDLVAAWSVDRLSRSLSDLVKFLEEMQAKGVDLYLHQQGLDTSTPAGRAMFQMLGVFSEFERAMIRERVNAGLARARSQGKTLGRPKISSEQETSILEARKRGLGIRRIAASLKTGVGTVRRVLSEHQSLS